MYKNRYLLAGGLSLVNVVLIFPIVLMIVYIGNSINLIKIYTIIQTSILIYIYLSFKLLLTNRFSFMDVNILINVFVGLSFLKILGYVFEFEVLVFGSRFTLEVLRLLIYIRLLNLRDDMYGQLRSLVYSSATSSALGLSLFLSYGILNFLFTALSYIILSTVFFRAAKESTD